ncbi:MAG TPA: helix-turn-helix transcriptional regulator [Bdellovibrio sp.]|uniref:helix-turn-helix domain-containing protein n=1 Tax=Bdellovibrio sp. TaxID=28201 RepID=UPI002EE7AC4B
MVRMMVQQQLALANFLKEKRIRAGLSQKEVAEKLGYSTAQFVSNWERGLSAPPVETLKVIAEMYNVDLDEVFNVTLESAVNRLTVDLREKFYTRKKSV